VNFELAKNIANAMYRAGYEAAAENFVNERAPYYTERETRRLERYWLS
jgi:hypothetical protein